MGFQRSVFSELLNIYWGCWERETAHICHPIANIFRIHCKSNEFSRNQSNSCEIVLRMFSECFRGKNPLEGMLGVIVWCWTYNFRGKKTPGSYALCNCEVCARWSLVPRENPFGNYVLCTGMVSSMPPTSMPSATISQSEL